MRTLETGRFLLESDHTDPFGKFLMDNLSLLPIFNQSESPKIHFVKLSQN